MQPLKFRNRQVIPPHILLGVWLVVWLKLNHVSKRGPRGKYSIGSFSSICLICISKNMKYSVYFLYKVARKRFGKLMELKCQMSYWSSTELPLILQCVVYPRYQTYIRMISTNLEWIHPLFIYTSIKNLRRSFPNVFVNISTRATFVGSKTLASSYSIMQVLPCRPLNTLVMPGIVPRLERSGITRFVNPCWA